jgi:hypothetical protein
MIGKKEEPEGDEKSDPGHCESEGFALPQSLEPTKKLIHDHIHLSANDFQIMSIPLGVFKIVNHAVAGSIPSCQINQGGTPRANQQDSGSNDVQAFFEVVESPFHVQPLFNCENPLQSAALSFLVRIVLVEMDLKYLLYNTGNAFSKM